MPAPPGCDGAIALTGYHDFVVDGVNYSHLADIPVHAGDDVTVVFTLQGCGEKTLSFVPYTASSGFNLPDQALFSNDTGTFTEGTPTMDVTVPPCHYQLDFVFGSAIEHFDPDANVTYHDEDRFIDGTQGGQVCETETTTSTSSPTTSSSITETTSSTTTTPSTTTTETAGTTTTTTTQIPFFPSDAAVALGVAGSLASAFVVLRRRL